MTKNTLNGSRKKVIKISGFRARLKTKSGRNVIAQRRKKNRNKLSITK